MKNFTLKSLILACSVLLVTSAYSQEWNISSESFNALGSIEATTTVEGLTIYANAEKPVVIDANNKSLDGMDFTHRMKLGGSAAFGEDGLPVARVIAFDVTGNTTITVMGMSSSSSSDRELVVAAGSETNEIGRFPALGASISKGVFNYEGGATTIYLFSPASGVNLYYIKAEPVVPDTREWNISSESFNALGSIEATTTVEGLTIYANAEKPVVVDANNKSLDGMDFTSRMKLGGSGAFGEDGLPVARVIAFDVTGNTTITVMGMSSSGSADRELVVAAGSETNEIGRFPALGASISKGVFNYVGEATTIYLFSPASGVNLYYIKAEPTPDAPAVKEWNISSESFNALGDIVETTTVEGLTIYASAEKPVTVDANNKTLDDMEFTHRMKLGGSGAFAEDGSPEARVLAFDVDGSCVITVMGMSSSGSADRELTIAAGTQDNVIGSFAALGASISKGEVFYSGGPTTIYLFSPSSGVNLYYIKAADVPTGIGQINFEKPDVNVYPNPAYDKVFIGVNKPTKVAIYSISGSLVKVKMVQSKSDFIDISDLNKGLYVIRSQENNGFTKKLVVN